MLLTPDDLGGTRSGVLGIVAGGAGAAGPVLGALLATAVASTAAVLCVREASPPQ